MCQYVCSCISDGPTGATGPVSTWTNGCFSLPFSKGSSPDSTRKGSPKARLGQGLLTMHWLHDKRTAGLATPRLWIDWLAAAARAPDGTGSRLEIRRRCSFSLLDAGSKSPNGSLKGGNRHRGVAPSCCMHRERTTGPGLSMALSPG